MLVQKIAVGHLNKNEKVGLSNSLVCTLDFKTSISWLVQKHLNLEQNISIFDILQIYIAKYHKELFQITLF